MAVGEVDVDEDCRVHVVGRFGRRNPLEMKP